ncbi:MAG: hypothetical protein KF813_05405 [Trueperaceae bacterium]|nr:hypothetical protein [Trueperaceae bacterium]
MHIVLSLVAFGLVVVNGFGTWAVSRRRPLVARLFLAASLTSAVVAVAYLFDNPVALWLLACACVLTFVSSFLNARLVIGVVEWQNHLARGATLLAILALGWWVAG